LKKLLVIVLAAATLSCASKPPFVPTAPTWDTIPAEVIGVLCDRLKSDAIATGQLSIVRVTQPLASPEALSAVGAITTGRHKISKEPIPIVHKAIPLTLAGSSCQWNPVASRQDVRFDEVVVELSAPLVNPYVITEAGMLARVTLGSEHETWYWIPLIPTGPAWTPRRAAVLPR
jgi:hypothetical protein